jgi:hypothetical protein
MPPAPDGLDLVCSGLSTPIAKNIPVPFFPKSPACPRPSRPTQGAYRDRHGRGAGCGGRGLRQACERSAGRIALRERIPARKTTAQPRTVKSCGPDASTLASSLAEARSAQPCRAKPQSARRRWQNSRSPGRARSKPLKPLRAGMPGDPGDLAVNTRVHTHYTMRTRGCGCTGHPAFPAPFLGARRALWAEFSGIARAHRAARVTGMSDMAPFTHTPIRGEALIFQTP